MDTTSSRCRGLLRPSNGPECKQANWMTEAIERYADPREIKQKQHVRRLRIFQARGLVEQDTTPESRDPQKHTPRPHIHWPHFNHD